MSDQEELAPYEPPVLPEHVPVTSESLTIDHIVRGMAEIAFNNTEKSALRLQALKELGKHKGMFVERHEHRTVDTSKQEAAKALFSQMTPAERRAWLEEHKHNIESALMNYKERSHEPHTPEPDPEEAIPVINQAKKEEELLTSFTGKPPTRRGRPKKKTDDV